MHYLRQHCKFNAHLTGEIDGQDTSWLHGQWPNQIIEHALSSENNIRDSTDNNAAYCYAVVIFGRIVVLSSPSVCSFVSYGLFSRKQMHRKPKIGANVNQGASNMCANFQLKMSSWRPHNMSALGRCIFLVCLSIGLCSQSWFHLPLFNDFFQK